MSYLATVPVKLLTFSAKWGPISYLDGNVCLVLAPYGPIPSLMSQLLLPISSVSPWFTLCTKTKIIVLATPILLISLQYLMVDVAHFCYLQNAPESPSLTNLTSSNHTSHRCSQLLLYLCTFVCIILKVDQWDERHMEKDVQWTVMGHAKASSPLLLL